MKDTEGDAREIVRHMRRSHLTQIVRACNQHNNENLLILKIEEAIASALTEIEKKAKK